MERLKQLVINTIKIALIIITVFTLMIGGLVLSSEAHYQINSGLRTCSGEVVK